MLPRRLATLTLAAGLLLAACAPSPIPSRSSGGSVAPMRQVTLLLGFRPDVQFAPFYLAQQNGLYAEAGLEVTIEHSTDVLRLVADGQAEFGVADATDVMIARTSGIPAKYVSALYGSFPVALIGAPDVLPDVPSELAGLRIGTPGRFGSSWHALLALLDAGGLTPNDVTIRAYPQFNQVEGLLNGDVDLITGFRNNEPLQLTALSRNVELLTIDEIAPLPGPGVIVGDELLAADRPLIERFVAATIVAQNRIADDPEVGLRAALVAVPAIAEDEETARSVLQATVGLWRGDNLIGQINILAWESGYDIMRKLGFIDGTAPLDEMYNEFIVLG